MSMIVFNKKLVTEHNQIMKAWNQLLMQRESFNVNQNTISAQYGGALEANHFIAYVRNSQYIKTRIAAPVGTFMIPRQNPFDNYNTLVWSAVGLQIKRDFNGRSKVFNAQG